MASKKEHKRKQKNRVKPDTRSATPPRLRQTPRDLNSLDLATHFRAAHIEASTPPIQKSREDLPDEAGEQPVVSTVSSAPMSPEQADLAAPSSMPAAPEQNASQEDVLEGALDNKTDLAPHPDVFASEPEPEPEPLFPEMCAPGDYSGQSETARVAAEACDYWAAERDADAVAAEQSQPVVESVASADRMPEVAPAAPLPAPAESVAAEPPPEPVPASRAAAPVSSSDKPLPVEERYDRRAESIPLEVDPGYWEKEEPELPEPEPERRGSSAGYNYRGPRGEDAPPPPSAPVGIEECPEGVVFREVAPGQNGDDEVWLMPNHRTTTIMPKEKRLYIVMITPEVAPCAKVGGLGDVVQGLGHELANRGHSVEIIAPMYSSMRYETIEDLHEVYGELWCPHYNQWRAEKVFQGKVGGDLQANFITGGDYTERSAIYGFDDDLYRFTYFCRQALEFMYKTDRRPDIIHCHDWTTGLVAPLLWDIYQPLGWDNSRIVYTIHNNECQGLCGFGDKLLSMVGLNIKNYMRPDRMQDDIHRNCINLMKAGIVYSNFVTTVSPTYAGELKTVAGGRGLQTTIAKNSAKVGGVLNGIDYDAWNPQTDEKLSARYSIGDDFYEKYKNKAALREWLGLWDTWKPVVSVVTRLTQQKGLDLIKRAIFSTLEEKGQFILLGSAPDPKVNNDFLRLQNELKDNHDVNLYIGYHEDLSRLIYAGSDIFVVPSLFEPCGLTQMISLRYGTVPVVRETGGLVDTVFDLDNSGRGLSDANGFTFRDPTPVSLDYGLKRAIRLWYDNPAAFNRLARNGMRYNYSWKNPAKDYENIYTYIKA